VDLKLLKPELAAQSELVAHRITHQPVGYWIRGASRPLCRVDVLTGPLWVAEAV